MKAILHAAAILTALCWNVYGQEFEVASIKAAPPTGYFHSPDSGSGGAVSADPGTFRCASCTLSSLIVKAFALQLYQLSGRQSLPNNTFVISAKVPPGATAEQFQVMLQNLLKDRFGLTYHFDQKEIQGYHLVVAKNGPKLTEGKPPFASVPDADAGDSHRHAVGGMTFFNGAARYRGDHQTTAELAQAIANQLSKPVDDQTGLSGKYDIRLSWAGAGDDTHSHLDGAPGGFDGAGHDHGGASPASDNVSGPTLFEALQSQLGLKLVAAEKSKARIFVVDHVEKTPRGN